MVSSMRMRNCCNSGWSSVKVRPRRMDESIRPLMEILSMFSRLDHSTTLHGGGQRVGKEVREGERVVGGGAE